jgi:hypothetical protein
MFTTLSDRNKKIEEFILKGTINNTDPFLRVGFFLNFELPYYINPISLKTAQTTSLLSSQRSNILSKAFYFPIRLERLDQYLSI